MATIDGFKITQKHYDTIIKQGYDNLPYETGGFLGGKNGIICALLPTFNKDWDENTDAYSLEDADMHRAYGFFHKHNLDYYGVYHTHPKGIAYPSEADINTGQKYHFIISYKDNETPQFNAFRVDAKQPIQLPLKIISNKGFSSLDLGNTNADPEKLKEQEEIKNLNDRIHNIIEGSQNKYEKLPPKDGELNSGFSTFA